MSDVRDGIPPPERGSINNPLSETDMPYTVETAGCYWIKLQGRELTQLPLAPAGATLDVEVRVDRIV